MRRLLLFGILFLSIYGLVLTPTMVGATTSNSITVETIPGETLTQIVTDRAAHSWPWYITRASGIVAGVSLIALMLSGIGVVTGHFFRWLEPITAWATHRALGITFVASIIIHMVTLLFDKFTPFSIVDVVVPWVSDYRPFEIFGLSFGSLFVSLGILAFYGSIIIVITSLFWIDSRPRLWKITHLLSYLVIAAVFAHALVLGTDLGHGIGRLLWIAMGSAVLFAIIIRLRRAKP